MLWGKSLPFENGFMYKPIANPNQKEMQEIKNKIILDDAYTSYGNSGYGQLSGFENKFIDETKYLHPIAFIESEQNVICDVVLFVDEQTTGYLYLSGSSFQSTQLNKHYGKIGRAKIEVNIFIKNFEKVL